MAVEFSPFRVSRWCLVVAALLYGYAYGVTSLPPFSLRASALVVGSGVLAAIVGYRQRRATTPRVSPRGLVIWAVLVCGLAGLQLVSYFQHPRAEHPTLSVIANAILDPDPVRALAFVVWLGVAAWIAER